VRTQARAGQTLRRWVGRHFYFGLWERLRSPDFVAQRRELARNAEQSAAAVRDLQQRKLSALLHHAYEQVPYYRRAFDERSLKPGDIRSAEDLKKLPLLTKAEIQRQREELRARLLPARHGGACMEYTGGSTGHPLAFYQDDHYRAVLLANLARSFALCGWRPGDPRAVLWGSDYDAQIHASLRGRVHDWLGNQVYLNAFASSEDELTAFAEQLRRFEPQLLVGYVSSLVAMARVLRRRRTEIPSSLGAIQSSAETLTPAQRELIESTFSCPVFDRYGCREMGNVAHECSVHAGLHVFTDLHVLEIVRDGATAPPGEEGLVVVTNLDNYAMPFIRYVIGDVGALAPASCACGLPFPLLARIQGRTSDIITSPSGRLIHGEFFTHLFYKVEAVRQFQVVQETLQDLTVRIVPGPGFDPAVIGHLESVIREHGDPGFRVETQLVDSIESAASGKFRFTISKVPPPFGSE
jgi:phenylacetate-CoA ligase